MTNLKAKILDTVKNNTITMIPKWKFILYSTLGIVGIIFSFLITVFLFSLILFVLSRHGFMYMPFFGFMATMHTLKAIPLFLLLCTIVLLIIIELISRSYSFSFRQPLAVTLLLLTTFAAIVSFIISQTGIHEYVREYAMNHHIDPMVRMYDRPIPFRPAEGVDILRGEVVASSGTSTTLRLFDGAIIVAYATTTGTSTFMIPSIGDDVIVFGNFFGEQFQILDIRKAPFGKHMPKGDMRMMIRDTDRQETVKVFYSEIKRQ